MRTHFNPFSLLSRTPSRRGSALLIVLGFLSFMIISAVSFSIYMRVERQASSNYRHSVTARHLLNSALVRAIDEVDAELRLQRSGNTIRKFPESNIPTDEWPGRVKASALADEAFNERDARVLSMEALSYLPPFLVNDVRRFAVYDNSADGSAKRYMGAKWRILKRLPDEEGIGRYAYVCVNLSDMFDINQCNAAVRDSSTNRVSIGHMFATDTERTDFENEKTQDIRYFSLQDFYAARHNRDTSEESSPYHAYLEDGLFTHFTQSFNWDQLFCTDSISKPEPTNGVACNIVLNQPLTASQLAQPRVETSFNFKTPFDQAAQNAFRGMTGWTQYRAIMPILLADYIDHDSIPKMLNVPSVEMVPMIDEINILPSDAAPNILMGSETVGTPPATTTVTSYYLQLMGQRLAVSDPATWSGSVSMPIYVEVVWPFKYCGARTLRPTFRVEVEAYLVVTHNNSMLTTRSFALSPSGANVIPLTQNPSVPTTFSFWNDTIKTEADCYKTIPVLLTLDNGRALRKIVDSDNNRANGFNTEFTVSLVVFASVKTGSDIVDRAPQMIPFPGAGGVSADQEFMISPKLFFQTSVKAVDPTAMNMQPMTYQWSGLEVADPRFNYNVADWTKNDSTTPASDGLNPTTRALLGTEGRDADIFMSVADTGALQSPGELGYIIRPFAYALDPSLAWNFSGTPMDNDAMFRTIRLYDHGANSGNNFRHDPVYENFYVMEADGTLKGARVNPLSDIPEELEAAIWGTPLDYWFASTNSVLTPAQRRLQTFNQSALHFANNESQWNDFRDRWAESIDRFTPEVNKDWRKTVSDYYADWSYMQWYSDNITRRNIFGQNNLVPNPMHEIDRKMLFSFSLDSFSDRQQLFLYILRAEATSPSFGSGPESGLRSLAGGRAVALVWRDPYPRGYNKGNDQYLGPAGTLVGKSTANNEWYPRNSETSPWDQYNYNSGSDRRYNGYHDTRILFFKQLDQ